MKDFAQRLQLAWRRSDELFELLPEQALVQQPIALRQPFLFYIGHLPAFAWNQMVRGVLGHPSFKPEFDELFEFGIDPVGVDRYEGGDSVEWPELDAVTKYRDEVRERVLGALPELAARAEARDADELTAHGRIVNLVIEHELMHHETLLYMISELPAGQRRRPREGAAPTPGTAAARTEVEVAPGEAKLGARFAEAEFGWDNEFERHVVQVPGFRIDSTPVRNAEYVEFIESGGYGRRELWRGESWDWRARNDVTLPRAWRRDGSGFAVRTMLRELPLQQAADLPASVSWAEADAFARWRGGRLPSEAELHRAAYSEPGGGQRPYPYGDAEPDAGRVNAGLSRWAPVPVGSLPGGVSAWGVHDLLGNGWEWTSTIFGPYPGFRPWAHTYPGYSQNFFDGRHYVMLGGSWATDFALLRSSFRNWFQPHYPYVFSQFRIVS